MGYPDMNCVKVKLYVHHMEIDAMFDFIHDRIKTPPEYWVNPKDLPGSVSGGYMEMFITYGIYTKIREVSEHSTWSDL